MEYALLREAANLASKQAVRRAHLLADMIRLESRFEQGESSHELEGLRRDAENCARAAERLIAYKPIGVAGPECPRCWILNGEHAPLRSDKGGNTLCCDTCEWRYGSRSSVAVIPPRKPEGVSMRRESQWPSISRRLYRQQFDPIRQYAQEPGREFQMVSIRNSQPAVGTDALEYHDSLRSRFARGPRIG